MEIGDSPAWPRLEGLIVDSIVIDNRNIFDTTQASYSDFLFRLANKLHITTRKWAIRDELLVKKGQPFSSDLAEESARNMRQRLALYDAWIQPERLPGGGVLVRVVTIDQWSLTGGADFIREGKETTWKLGFEEDNLLGTGQIVSFNFYNRSSEGKFVDASYLNRRLLGYPAEITLGYSSDPMNELKAVHAGHPYYDLSQRLAYDFGIENLGGRRDIYRDNTKIAQSMRSGDFMTATGSYRFGDYHHKLQLGLDYLYRFEKTSDKRILSTDPGDSSLAQIAFPADSVYHQLEGSANLSIFRYVRFRYIDGIGYTEDFSVGHFLTAFYGRAFMPDFNGHVFDRAGYSYSRNVATSRQLLLFTYGHTYWFKGGYTIRHLASIEAKFYNRVSGPVTLASRAAYLSDVLSDGNHTLILGGTNGIRGFPKYFRSGNRRLVLNLEARIHSNLNILSLVPGGVIFADMGNIWQPGAPVKLTGFHKSAGVGLRFGFINSTRNIVRIDLSYTDERTWDLTIGTKQYFEANF